MKTVNKWKFDGYNYARNGYTRDCPYQKENHRQSWFEGYDLYISETVKENQVEILINTLRNLVKACNNHPDFEAQALYDAENVLSRLRATSPNVNNSI